MDKLLAFWIKTAGAQSGGANPQGFQLPDPFAGKDWAWVVGKIADFFLLIGGPLTAIMVLIGGFYMVTAAGNPEKFNIGKKTIVYAAIGFVVILAAKGVANVIQGIFR